MEEFRFDFENLNVYQKALDFIDHVFVVYRNLDQEYRYAIGNNLIRAALSVANNIAEGNGKKSKKEKVRYFEISSDSARECVSVFNVLSRQNLVQKDRSIHLRVEAREITSMLHGLIESNQR